MFWHTEDPFASGLHTEGHPSKPRPHYPFRRSRAQYQYQPELAREEELLRRQLYQHELDQRAGEEHARSRELHRRRALAQREHQAAAAAARQYDAIFTFAVAARKIQRWWRGTAAARKAVAAAKVAGNLAARQARRVTESLRRLTELEATIKALPKPAAEQLSKRVSSKGISVFENTLERLILSADDIPTHGSDAARAIRKRLVRTANTRLQAFDEVVAAKAAKAAAERAAEQEAEVDTDDEATAGSETGESEIGAPMSPVDVPPQAAEVKWDEEGREWVATMEAESQACLAPPPSPPGETQPLLQKPSPPSPHDKFLGMPATISTSHESTSEDDTDTDDDGDEDLVNAAIADLLAPRPLGSSSQRRSQLGRDFQSTGHEASEIEPDSSDSDSSFVEVRAESAASEDEDEAFRCMYAKTSDASQQDDGGEPAVMGLDSDPTMLQMSDAATDAGAAAAAASRLNALVAKFADELADIELQQKQTPGGVRNAARDLQAAIHAILPTVRGGN